MAGAYAKEFEKWLQGSKNGQDKQTEAFDDADSIDMDDSNDEFDSCRTKYTTGSHELSPVLDSDHLGDNLSSGTQNCFQDEPPILEPVGYGQTKISDNSTSSNSFSKDSDSSMIQKDLEKIKEEIKSNTKSFDSEKCFYNKVEKSENIFDKFSLITEGDDFPPPLIPSHEAHLTTVDAKDEDSPAEKSYATLQNLSPNFCAMEADSTSEMMKVDQNRFKDRGKAPINTDVGMECDSTCMLSVSPHVGSNIESNPNTPFSPEISADDSQPLSWNSFSSRETYTSLMPFSEQTHLDYRNNFLPGDQVGVYHHDSGDWDRECPKLEAVHDVEEISDAVPLLNNVETEHPREPPVLSVVPPPNLITPKMAARRKRHTIDSVESLSLKHKTYSKDSSCNKSINLGPSSKSSHNLSLSKRAGHRLSISKKKDIPHSRNHPRPKKHRERSKTLPIVDLISFGSHLPKDLFDFVTSSSELSTLQNRMHQLLYLLFPQLAPELNLMSPESTQFETLLKDLIHYLKEPGAKSNTKNEFNDTARYSLDDSSKRDSDVNDINSVSGISSFGANTSSSTQTLDTDSDFEQSPKWDLCEHKQDSRVNNDGPCCSKDPGHHSCSSVFSNSSRLKNGNPDLVSGAISYNSVIPKFSQLNLNKESERILKNQPSVLVHKNPSALHKHFCKLSCSTLQLLLPDLSVSLMKEFSKSPKDLLHFIDSVIASNSHVE